MTILMIDDERTFADDRDAVIIRTVDEALAYIAENPSVDELWLDYVLRRSETIDDFLFALVSRQRNEGSPVIAANKVVYHSSSNSGYSLVASYCEDLGLPAPEMLKDRSVIVG